MNNQKAGSVKSLASSSSNYLINLFCLIFFFATMFFLHRKFPQMGAVLLTIICLLAVALPLWLYDFLHLKVHKRPSTGLRVQRGKINRQRVFIKLIGLHGTFLIILLLYHFNPTYRASPNAETFYNTFFDFLNFLAPWIVILSFVYFWQIDQWQEDPYDGYWHMGCLLTGRYKDVNPVILKEHTRVWFIKGFFTPFMFALLVAYVNELLSFDWQLCWRNWPYSFLLMYNYLIALCYTFDVIYHVLGYILTFRLWDTHIRSTEPTLLGWVVCLACYSPFYSIFGLGLFPYDDGLHWYHWLGFYPVLNYFWAIMIIFLSLVYGLASVAIGYRSSNLTFRGLITSGPYRYTKHPAYVCKVASWWLISLPFLSVENFPVALKHTLNLSVVTFIYYLRARTEENHLSNYPEYVEYARWINEHGLFSFITKHFPALQYSEEKCRRWKSIVWFKKLT